MRRALGILDADLAILYGVPIKALLQAVKRNVARFPGDFVFQPNNQEVARVTSQTVTSKSRGGRRYAPYAFTEQGVAMLSSGPRRGFSDDTVLLQKLLLVAGHPAEDLRLVAQRTNEVVNIEIDRYVRLILAREGSRPRDVGDAMMFVHR